MRPKNRAAVALGRRGGRANTEAQHAARRRNARLGGATGGRPRLRPRCPRCEAQKRTCYHSS